MGNHRYVYWEPGSKPNYSTETYFGDLSVGDKIVYEGEVCTIVDIDSRPLTEDEYYGPAKPDYLYFTVEFGDNTTDEFGRWESDVAITLKEAH